MGQILGQPAQDGDGDPIQTRWQQIWTTPLGGDLGSPTSPVYYNWIPGSGYQWWQYFDNGMMACGINGCASVIYGHIFTYYDNQGEFQGPLGFPTGDVTQLPDGTLYAVFDSGVLWQNAQGQVEQLQPLSPSLVQSLSTSSALPSGLNPSIDGITQFAQQKVQQFAQNALNSNQKLKDNVSSIQATTTFDHVGQGACSNANASDNVGIQGANSRPHVFKVHFEFGLQGCAGVFGGANADTHVTVQLVVNSPSVQAFLRSYTIDSVGSPYGAGDSQIESGLNTAFANIFGQDILGVAVPKGFTVVAVIVDDGGNANIYIESICTASTALIRVDPSLRGEALSRLRRLRDEFLVHQKFGADLMRIMDAVGPVLIERVRAEETRPAKLAAAVAAMLSNVDPDDSVVRKELSAIGPRIVHLEQAIATSTRNVLEHVLRRVVDFVRAHADSPPGFADALKEFAPILEREIEATTAAQPPGMP